MTRATRTALLSGCLVLGLLFAPGRGRVGWGGGVAAPGAATAVAPGARAPLAGPFADWPAGAEGAALVSALAFGPGLALHGTGR